MEKDNKKTDKQMYTQEVQAKRNSGANSYKPLLIKVGIIALSVLAIVGLIFIIGMAKG